MERWCGKVAIVTGASSGIGAAVACQFVEDGLRVVGFARRSEKVEELSRKLAGKKGKLYARKVDISDERDVIDAFQWVCQNVGPVDILVNNAGVLEQTSLVGGDPKLWRKTFETNVLGLLTATKEAIDSMIKTKTDGHILFINSIAGHYHLQIPGINVYGASKFAVTNLAERFRRELVACGTKIRVTSISPGAVDTEIVDRYRATPEGRKIVEQTPMLKAEDIAAAVAYAVGAPPHVQIHEVIIRPTGDPN